MGCINAFAFVQIHFLGSLMEIVSGDAKPPLNGGETRFYGRDRGRTQDQFCPFAASRIRFAKLRLPLTPLRDFWLARCSKIVPGKHPPPFSGGFRPPFTEMKQGRMHLPLARIGRTANNEAIS